jgi:uncharacterized membrane protein HdeD (DUF308 family)
MASATASLAQTKVPWWLILIQGIAMIILGILFFTAPAATLVTLIWVLGIYWLIGGILDIVAIFIDRTAWGWKLVSGIIGIVAGLLIMGHPLTAALIVPATFIWLFGLMGIVIGVIGIIRAFQGDGWGAGILGVFSILFGLILLGNAMLATLGVPFLLGIIGLVGGVVAIWQSFQVKKAQGA